MSRTYLFIKIIIYLPICPSKSFCTADSLKLSPSNSCKAIRDSDAPSPGNK